MHPYTTYRHMVSRNRTPEDKFTPGPSRYLVFYRVFLHYSFGV